MLANETSPRLVYLPRLVRGPTLHVVGHSPGLEKECICSSFPSPTASVFNPRVTVSILSWWLRGEPIHRQRLAPSLISATSTGLSEDQIFTGNVFDQVFDTTKKVKVRVRLWKRKPRRHSLDAMPEMDAEARSGRSDCRAGYRTIPLYCYDCSSDPNPAIVTASRLVDAGPSVRRLIAAVTLRASERESEARQ